MAFPTMSGSNEMDVALDEDAGLRVQRACDSCRTRKIRCDRATPCSNCKASKLYCQTTAPTQKSQKQRIHVSDDYERKLDRIEERLVNIEKVLEKLADKLGNLDLQKNPEHSIQSGVSRVAKSPLPITDVQAHTPAPFEGDTTMNSQSAFARELLEKAVEETPSIGLNAEIRAALSSLQNMFSTQNQFYSTTNEPQPFFNKLLAETDPKQLQAPPWEAVEDVLDKASIYPTMCFAVAFPFLKISNLKQIFKEAFDLPEHCSTGRRILIYGVLYNLFTEFGCYPLVGRRVEKFREYARQSRTQMEIALSQLDLFITASYENVLALVLAASYAVELCKPSLCWILTSTAIGLCQNLGYHRFSSMKNDTEEERSAKIYVFWFIYTMDRVLSLRLGRASAMQDWDISLPYPALGQVTEPSSGSVEAGAMQLYWIRMAKVQGQIYERLFSPAACLKSREERVLIATELADSLNQIRDDRAEASVLDFTFLGSTLREAVPQVSSTLNQSDLPSRRKENATDSQQTPADPSVGNDEKVFHSIEGTFGDVGDLFYHSDIVTHYSTLCLIYRSISEDNTHFSPQCLEAARAALSSHQRCAEQFNIKGNENLWAGYIHWSILQAPFTPFIVMISFAITACSHPDIASLSDFVSSLESCRGISDGADKLYKTCHLFLQVAKLYVDAKTKEASENAGGIAAPNGQYYTTADGQRFDPGTVDQFDPYLSALGLMPSSVWPHTGLGPEQSQMQPGIQASPQGNTFDGQAETFQNQQMGQDWFSGSRYILGLMESDVNMPDFTF